MAAHDAEIATIRQQEVAMIAILRETQVVHNGSMDREWILAELKRLDLEQARLAEATGIAPSGISRMMSGARDIKVKEAEKIMDLFRRRAVELGLPPPVRLEVSAPFPADDQVGNRDLPIFASAEGGPNGAMVISSEPIEHVRRPQPLFNVPTGFGCYVIGDSMNPAYEHGDMILIHPGLPVGPGNDCLFTRKHPDGGMDALIKKLVRTHPDRWRVKQHNPRQEFNLERKEWQQAMRIVGKYNWR